MSNIQKAKTYISNTFSNTESDKLNNFLIIYISVITQDQFETVPNQKNQSIFQDQLSDWNNFFNKLYYYFSLSNPVNEAINILDNLHIKPNDKIST